MASNPKDNFIFPGFVLPFFLITLLFPLWGFANDLTNPMVSAFSKILILSNFQGSLVQTAFYGGYFAMAFPAAIFIKVYSYRAGVITGLLLYAIGALLFIPATLAMQFWPFLLAYFIMTCGLSFLETTANPYILAMGPEKTATQRLNFAQSFNPLGSLIGMFTAQQIVLVRLSPLSKEDRLTLSPEALGALTKQDLSVVQWPYVVIGGVVLSYLFIVILSSLPHLRAKEDRLDLKGTFRRLSKNKRYREGVMAQFFYIGAQIMCWTFIIQYGTEVLMGEGMSEAEAIVAAQGYNIVAMILFASSRFICTALLRFINAGILLCSLAVLGFLLVLGTIFLPGLSGLYCLVGVSACMSLMFPTIYGVALKGLGEDAKIGAAGLIVAILGGSVMPPLQASIMDLNAGFFSIFELSAVRASFVVPLVCFAVVALFGWRTASIHLKE